MTNHVFTATRTYDAPRKLVWKAWTEAASFDKWFGPAGWTSRAKTFDVRPGGILHSCLIVPDGTEMWAKFVYREVVPEMRLCWEHFFSDKDGGITRHPFQAAWPLKLLTTVIFEDAGNATKLTLTWTPLDANEAEIKAFDDNTESMTKGWGGTFDQLEGFLKSMT